jgi:hypothetical protein
MYPQVRVSVECESGRVQGPACMYGLELRGMPSLPKDQVTLSGSTHLRLFPRSHLRILDKARAARIVSVRG